MKYLLSWLAGAIVGALMLPVALYYNPFVAMPGVSPLAVSGQPLVDLSYSAVPVDAIAYTNNGDERVAPYPEKIAELWEPTIRKTTVLVTLLTNSRGSPEGIGVKFASESERTNLLEGDALIDSAWHIYLPESGSLFVDQSENLWSYVRYIVLPARWNSADSWRGTWYGVTTTGPTALGTARVSGSSGRFAGMSAEAVESVNARAYSALKGPVSITGSLTIAVTELTAD
ncbi:MAG: hypothetical protein WD795_14165 [Woeseia sp.]